MNKALSIVSMTAMLAACSGAAPQVKPAPAPMAECDQGPPWTCFKSGPCPFAEMKDSLCAVGSADQIQSYNLGIQTASTRARTEMQAVIQSKVDGFTRAVQDSLTKQGVGEDATQKVGDLAQNVVQGTLNGVTVPKTYYNKDLKVFFAIAVIDVKTLANGLKGLKEAKGLSDSVKNEIDRRAAGIVDDWQKERDRLDDGR
jgi:hypothetical protein